MGPQLTISQEQAKSLPHISRRNLSAPIARKASFTRRVGKNEKSAVQVYIYNHYSNSTKQNDDFTHNSFDGKPESFASET
jgi:hypothetical protein